MALVEFEHGLEVLQTFLALVVAYTTCLSYISIAKMVELL